MNHPYFEGVGDAAIDDQLGKTALGRNALAEKYRHDRTTLAPQRRRQLLLLSEKGRAIINGEDTAAGKPVTVA